jgi:hypothetical protein
MEEEAALQQCPDCKVVAFLEAEIKSWGERLTLLEMQQADL